MRNPDPAQMTDKELFGWADLLSTEPFDLLAHPGAWIWGNEVYAEVVTRERAHSTWPTEAESFEQFLRSTLPVYTGQPYFHPGGCPNCGTDACYMQCPNHPDYYSFDDEIRDMFAEEGRL